jgi:GT2 family glycosyltransferase
MTAPAPLIAVIVPIYNRRAITCDFLRSFSSVRYPRYEMILVDDGSTDGSADAITREFPSVRIIRTHGGLWWTRATNIGIADARGREAEYILTINDDVLVDPFLLDALVRTAESRPGTLVGSTIYYQSDPERIWYAGGKMHWLAGDLVHRTSADDGPLCWLTGMGTLVPVQVFDAIGSYDEIHFPQYAADADFSLRAVKAGFPLAIAPDARIWNRTEESVQRRVRERVTPRTFFLPLFSNKSDAKLSLRLVLYRRHWPAAIRPVAFVAYYAKFLAKQVKRLIHLSSP